MTPLFNQFIQKILSNTKHHVKIPSRNIKIFKRKTKEDQLSPYIICRATMEDRYKILQVMHDTYYFETPTVRYLRVQQNPVFDELALRAMAEGMTLVAKCKYNGEIVGACINQSSHPWDPILKEKLACTVKCDKVRQLLLFDAYVQAMPDLWKCNEVQKIFEMTYLFVLRGHKQNNLEYRLLRDSKELGADCGYKVIRCDAVTSQTADICDKLKMKMIAEVQYCSYLSGKNLEPVFDPPHPNEAVKIFIDQHPQEVEETK